MLHPTDAPVEVVEPCYQRTDLGYWKITRYYVPEEGQEYYYNGWKNNVGMCSTKNLYYTPYRGRLKGNYYAELCMQSNYYSGGDPYSTANGTDLRTIEPFTTAACPQWLLGQRIEIDGVGIVQCNDTGGGLAGIDLFAGTGTQGYENIYHRKDLAGTKKVSKIKNCI